jgi:glycogen(starch) synthase
MKILLGSHCFSPSTGGIETCSIVLAREFRDAGNDVRIVTQTASSNSCDDCDFNVLRQPSLIDLVSAIRWCDVFYQNNVSLQTAWPLAFLRKPWFVTTATWLGSDEKAVGYIGHVKRFFLRFANNIYISKAIANHVGHRGTILGNPYDHETFRLIPNVKRTRDIVFLGRLVTDKGCDLLIESIRQLTLKGLHATMTIVGDGPERKTLQQQVNDSSLQSQVIFKGKMSGNCLAEELNCHRIIVVPSRWNEPFGIVALEGMACGCIPVVSSGGGLPEATGGLGHVFLNGNVDAMTKILYELLTDVEIAGVDFSSHLTNFHATSVANAYLKEFQRFTA